jgi:hypothetical protein
VPQARQSRSHADRHEHRMSRHETWSRLVRDSCARRCSFTPRAWTRTPARREWKQLCSLSCIVCHRTRWTARDIRGRRNSRNIDARRG